ncbi:MAG TPA: selenocysteine-specific translation elongation factor [Gemmatimonadales bacterium]
MIIGTAGHVDHGKSALVTALTGRPMDRLAEERRRGITIELGFAPLVLPGLGTVGLVDVPGHEDFVRTMVAGASGIDCVLLVVDGQQGIQPQTLEHLAVVEQLGIPVGIPVLTKADLVEPEWLALVQDDLMERLHASAVQFGPPVVTSVVTGQGIDALRQRIRDLADGRQRRGLAADLFRMPVDRVFAVAGAGSVVTGTVWSGSLSVGDQIRLEPGGRTARVRAIEQFGRPVDRASPGGRTAIGLAGVSRGDIDRGQVAIAAEADWSACDRLDAVVRLLPDAPRPLGARTRLRFLLGTAEVMARAYPREPVPPGAEGMTRLVLEAPTVVRGGDRFVLRSYSPVTTIGGGRVVDPRPPRRATWPAGLTSEVPAVRLGALVRRQPGGRRLDQLAILLGLPPGEAEELGGTAGGLRVAAGRVVAEEEFQRALEQLLERVARFHVAEPASPGMSIETLRQSLGSQSWLADPAIETLVDQGHLVLAEGFARSAGHVPASSGGDAEVDRLAAHLRETGLAPPTVAELAALGLRDLTGALRMVASRGLAEAVERDRFFSTEALGRFRSAIEQVGQGGAEVTPAALRDQLGLSRKFLIPLLEWADRRGLTWRDQAGVRRVRPPMKA